MRLAHILVLPGSRAEPLPPGPVTTAGGIHTADDDATAWVDRSSSRMGWSSGWSGVRGTGSGPLPSRGVAGRPGRRRGPVGRDVGGTDAGGRLRRPGGRLGDRV